MVLVRLQSLSERLLSICWAIELDAGERLELGIQRGKSATPPFEVPSDNLAAIPSNTCLKRDLFQPALMAQRENCLTEWGVQT